MLKTMKLFVVLLACIATVLSAELTEEQKKILEPYQEACMAEVGVDKATLQEAKMKTIQSGKLNADQKVACFSACMFKKLGFVNEEGEMDEDMVRAFGGEQIPSDKLELSLKECKSVGGKDKCEVAINTLACFMERGAVVEM